MSQELADPQDVAACLEKVRDTLSQLGQLQDNLKHRAASLTADADDIAERLRAVGLDTPEALEARTASLEAYAPPVSFAPAATTTAGVPKPRKLGRMV